MIACVYLLATVALNIIARPIFSATDGRIDFLVPGAIEQATYALLIFTFAAIPAAGQAGLVNVDVFIGRLPRPAKSLLERFWRLVLVVLACVLCWKFGVETVTKFGRGDLTQDLRIPHYIFYAVITVECAALAIISLSDALASRRTAALEPAEIEQTEAGRS